MHLHQFRIENVDINGKSVSGKHTSASPAGHGAPKATEHSGGPGIPWGCPWIRSATSPTYRPIHSRYPVFTCYKGVCRVLGSMLQPTYRPRPRITMAFPCRMTGWHHAAPFSETSTVVAARFFDQKNYGTRTHIVNARSFRLLRLIPTPTENAPLARKTLD